MFPQVSDLRGRAGARVAAWKVGTYLTDGVRLFRVTGVEERHLCLEDASTECLERCPIDQAEASMLEVEACFVS
jgi:hypothetical protein